MHTTDIIAAWTRRDVLVISALGLLSVLLWRVPVLGLLFYPFRLFNTFVHELSHGFATVFTGGKFHGLVILLPNQNARGYARLSGGVRWIVNSAGYVGSALFGGVLILLTSVDVPAKVMLIWIAAFLGVLCVLFVRNLFGFIVGLALAGGLYYAGWQLDDRRATQLFVLLAVQTTLSSFNSLVDLLRISADPRRAGSDAHHMAELTGIPTIFWALLWCAIAVAILIVAVTWAYGMG